MKIAQFRNPEFNVTAIFEQTEGERLAKHCGYVRISEYAEAEFPPFHDAAAEIEILARTRAEVEKKHRARLQEIDARCAELVAGAA